MEKRDTINVVIGKHMAELRQQFGLTQKDICQVIGVNRNTYKDYEVGNRTIPLDVLREISKFYKVSTNYFFENMPNLSLEESTRLLNYSMRVAGNKEKYITLDITDPNKVKKYLKSEEEKVQNKVRLRVKRLRIENNKTQKDLAEFLGVDKSTYNKYENGKRKFNNDIVKKLADYYNIQVSDIVD